jgi:hypothetical protein
MALSLDSYNAEHTDTLKSVAQNRKKSRIAVESPYQEELF